MHSVIQETACNLKIFNIKNKIQLYIYNLFVCLFILKQMPAVDQVHNVVLQWDIFVSPWKLTKYQKLKATVQQQSLHKIV